MIKNKGALIKYTLLLYSQIRSQQKSHYSSGFWRSFGRTNIVSSSSLMASKTLTLQIPSFLSPQTPITLPFSLSLSTPTFTRTSSLSLSLSRSPPPKSRVFATPSPIPGPTPPASSPIAESTRTIASIAALALTLSKLLAQKLSALALELKSIAQPNPNELLAIQSLQDTVVCAVGPLFFAAIRAKKMSTPLMVVAKGLRKWVRLYSGILMVRVLLSWFPNIPWDRQPLLALRDLCDPYLNLFRNIIPPVFNALDISPLFAFLTLTFLGALVNFTPAN